MKRKHEFLAQKIQEHIDCIDIQIALCKNLQKIAPYDGLDLRLATLILIKKREQDKLDQLA